MQAVLPNLASASNKAINKARSHTDIPDSHASVDASVNSSPNHVHNSDSNKATKWRSGLSIVHATGDGAGDYKLFYYNSKLTNYTDAKPVQRFWPIEHRGRNKLIPVSFIAKERTIYRKRFLPYIFRGD